MCYPLHRKGATDLHYRCVIQVQVTDLPRIRALRDALTPFAQHNIVINPGLENQEPGFIELQRCHHDEIPTKPCEVLFRWDGVNGITVPDRP